MSKDKSPGRSGLLMKEPLLFERSVEGRPSGYPGAAEVREIEPAECVPQEYLRDDLEGFPELSEPEVVRHFVRLSQWNYGVDTGFYPLGSCTMKYNPKVNEAAARLPGFAGSHPLLPDHLVQGPLELMWRLERFLAEISGFSRITLNPAAGAQGELVALLMVRKYHELKGEPRSTVLVPDSAHGTNPASCALAGYDVKGIVTGPDGVLEPEVVAEAMDESVAALMVTNPNTLGLFETGIVEINDIVHSAGGLVYCDGANLNALMGRTKPGELGFDLMHFNLHKTFSTPHGGGGPGSGPVGLTRELEAVMPAPTVEKRDDGEFYLEHVREHSIGRTLSFWGHFGVMVRAYAYIRSLGAEGLKHATDMAVLNANYIKESLKDTFDLPYDTGPCMHEVVFSDKRQNERDVKTMDIAKRLIDHGFHPPTVYFPLIVAGALMIEPTESESKDTIDEFIAAMKEIAGEDPDLLHAAPSRSVVSRLDETTAARKPVLRWTPEVER